MSRMHLKLQASCRGEGGVERLGGPSWSPAGKGGVYPSISKHLCDLHKSPPKSTQPRTCAGYLGHPFSKESVFTRECCRCDPSFPAFLPGSHILQEGNGCPDHYGCTICSPSAIRLVTRCVPSSPAMLTLWQPGWVPCLHHATPGVLPPNPSCL